MKDISTVDRNFKVDTKIDKEDIVFFNALDEPFEINGVYFGEGQFRRMPSEVANTLNKGIQSLHTHTAGGRLRFKTNSPYVAIHTKIDAPLNKYPFFSISGKSGFDMYVKRDGKDVFYREFMIPEDYESGYESVIDFDSEGEKEITINFPIYSDVYSLFIGLSKDADVKSPEPYTNKNVIVYYGSSITQGACATRPGNTYENFISRKFDCDYINLGFGGSAIAEKEIAEYISSLENMTVFVYDYDHNAYSPEFLKETHENMFNIIRSAHPHIPIIILPRPRMYLLPTDVERHEVIKETYETARNSGDEKVYFMPGCKLMEIAGNDGTIENTHPSDLVFFSMAEAISEVLEGIIKRINPQYKVVHKWQKLYAWVE